jgi:hypothetical protein
MSENNGSAGGRTSHRVAALNEHYALANIGSYKRDTLVIEFDTNGNVVCVWEFAAFKRNLCQERPVKIEGRSVPLATYWLSHKDARRYNTMVFAPPGSSANIGDDDYNTWRGLAIKPAPGDWWLNRHHIREVICAGNEDHEKWMHNWIAALVQRPGQHGWVAPVLKGGQGIGKGHFANVMLGGLFRARNYAHLTVPEHLTSDFNSHLEDRVLVFADEAVWGNAKVANRLKGLITEPEIMINRKHMPQEIQLSALHIIIASNADRPLPVERDDRRLLVLQVSEEFKQDQPYFAALHEELRDGGHAAMLDYFLNYEVDWDLLRVPPETDAKREMKAESLSAEDEWWRDVLESADADVWQDTWAMKIGRGVVLDRYSEWFDKFKARGMKKNATALGNYFAKHFNAGGMSSWPHDAGKTSTAINGKRENAWQFPPLPECRDVFDRATGTRTGWPDAEDDTPFVHPSSAGLELDAR